MRLVVWPTLMLAITAFSTGTAVITHTGHTGHNGATAETTVSTSSADSGYECPENLRINECVVYLGNLRTNDSES